jgi:hypothetical protein
LSNLKAKGWVEYKEIDITSRYQRLNYFAKATLQNTYGKGYTLVSNGAINGAIDGRITPTELKLYILLLKYSFNVNDNCYPSTLTLAKEMGIEQPNIVYFLNNLEFSGYIERQYIDNDYSSISYRLLV